MNRPGPVALAFMACLSAAFAALVWMTATVLRLDAAEADARRRADLEENVRLALWRIDSAVTPILTQENARPIALYVPVERASATAGPGMQWPSGADLHGGGDSYVRFHFQVSPAGILTSPEFPGARKDLNAIGDAMLASDVVLLRDLAILVDRKALLEAAPSVAAPLPPLTLEPWRQTAGAPTQSRGAQDFQARSQSFGANNALSNNALMNQSQMVLPGESTNDRTGLMAPVWRRDQLLLVRKASIRGETYLQGCWLDWPELARQLAGLVADLLPDARLVPVREDVAEPTRLLASLPARLEPGAWRDKPNAGMSPLRLSLLAAWACAVLASAAVAALLVGVVKLSERRAAFVSAVTHELRTPLTTFRLYAEMLADGMVSDAAQRQSYLSTLRQEAERLSRLVENVLAYARLERGRTRDRLETVSLDALLSGMEMRLRERAEQAEMEVVIEAGETALQGQLHTDPSAVEQILFNLVDNACKYAAAATDRRIHVKVRLADGAAWLRINDHGPGISTEQARRLFRPFSKSAQDAAQSAPGIGLGLALSRRIARELGGDLRWEPAPSSGACFIVSIPASA